MDDGAGVARQLARELRPDRRGQELRRLELLQDDERLGLRAGPRLVVRREREEDDEALEDREPGCEDAEDARRTVAVREVRRLTSSIVKAPASVLSS